MLEGATCAVQVLGSTPSMSRRQNCSAAAVATVAAAATATVHTAAAWIAV